jgi:DNA-binding transcriptional LysR family regulator
MKNGFTIGRGQLDGVLAFLRVAELQSFRAAAAELGVSPSAMSHVVRALESRVGVTLLTRTTRKVGLTQAGQRFLERARPAIGELLGAFESAQTFGEQVTGLLRLNVPRAVAPYLVKLLGDFCAAYPAVQVEIFADDQLANIVEEGFDAGVRLGNQVDADMVAVRLTAPFRFTVVGSPSYLARYGRPQQPEDLDQHRCIGFRPGARSAVNQWEFKKGDRRFKVTLTSAMIVNDWVVSVSAAVSGLGLAYAPAPLARPFITSGELESVLDSFCPDAAGLFLYYPSRSQALPKLRVFAEFARKSLSRGLEQAGIGRPNFS